MPVLFLTVFLSLLLALLFVVLFMRAHKAGEHRSAESASLLPFADEEATSPPGEESPRQG